MELIEKLGIDWKLLIAQIVNFLILLFVLTKFAFKPLIKMLDERSETVEQSLENAEKIKKNLEEANKQKEEVILRAREEAQNIIFSAKKNSDDLRQRMLLEAQNNVATTLETGRKQLESDKKTMEKELQGELADLVIQATRKVTAETINSQLNREFINKVLKQ